MAQLVLSLFPGIGLLDRAFEEEGFTVVRGPDVIWGGDIRTFHPPAGKFDGIIGGPPCQTFSIMKRLNPRAGEKHGNLIPEFERVVKEAGPIWFIMENVPPAPLPVVPEYVVRDQLIRDVWVGGKTTRLRRFSFGTRGGSRLDIQWEPMHDSNPTATVLAGGGGRCTPVAINGSGKRKKTASGAQHGPSDGPRVKVSDLCRLQGLPGTFFEESPFSVEGQRHALGNGVPLSMGRAVARAVLAALGIPPDGAPCAP